MGPANPAGIRIIVQAHACTDPGHVRAAGLDCFRDEFGLSGVVIGLL